MNYELNEPEISIINTYRKMKATDAMLVFRNEKDTKIVWKQSKKYLTKNAIGDNLKLGS
jgi:hypothetical protein